ncbi:50S ribosomal protein L21 [Parcubacteria bacterium DG_72]|nr:MAG: 50S ribosomal protein L21 [Parcubacteria bacterium DG_72]
MLAVIRTGGKQYKVSPGDKLKVEKLNKKTASAKATAVKEGEEVIFSQVLLVEKNKKLYVGTPLVKGAKVLAKVLSQGKGKKVIVFKYKPKTRYKKKQGHRQLFTEVEITKIEIE